MKDDLLKLADSVAAYAKVAADPATSPNFRMMALSLALSPIEAALRALAESNNGK